MYISTTLKSKQTFQATNPKQSNPQSSLSHQFKLSDTVYSFNVKPIKMLSDTVAEAFGLIHRHPSGENFCSESNHSLSLNLVNTRTSITYYVQLRFSTSWPWNISHLAKVEENWPSKITFQKAESIEQWNSLGDIMGGFCPGGFCPRGDFVQGDFVLGGFCPGGFCPRTSLNIPSQNLTKSKEIVRYFPFLKSFSFS